MRSGEGVTCFQRQGEIERERELAARVEAAAAAAGFRGAHFVSNLQMIQTIYHATTTTTTTNKALMQFIPRQPWFQIPRIY